MNKSTIFLMLLMLAVGVVTGVLWPRTEHTASPAAAQAGKSEPLFYRHPMTPSITSPVPAKDDMGMDYIPVYADEAGTDDEALVKISPVMVNNLGVRTEAVTRGTLAREISTVGYIDYDERLLSHVHLRVEGWVEDLRVRTLGERVKAGDLLFKVYSPEWVTAQTEYLQSLSAGSRALRTAGRERLEALGLTQAQIERLEKSRKPESLTAVYARQDGIVAELDVREGMFVTPGTKVMTLAGLDSVWVLVDVFEAQADWVDVGQTAEVRLPHKPDRVWQGEVEYIYPQLDPKTRTLKARLRFPNPEETLRPNMYADVRVHADPREQALSVPAAAVIRTEDEARVILAHGEGRFDPAAVKTGIESGDRVEILEGLAEGDKVVVSAQFLLDSEASLQASLRRMTAPTADDSDAAQATEAAPAAITGEGTLNRVDAAARTVNLSHGPIPALAWPAMTMDFAVVDDVDLSALKPGQKVRFSLQQTDDGVRVTELTAAE